MADLDPTVLDPIVQGDVLQGGIPKRTEVFLFFNIVNASDFCTKLGSNLSLFASNTKINAWRADIEKKGDGTIVPGAAANIAFSFAGLQAVCAMQSLTAQC